LLNKPAYRSNPEEPKEIQRQVDGLLEKQWIRESMGLCAIMPCLYVILIPKRDETVDLDI